MLRHWHIFFLVFCPALWSQGNAPEPRSWTFNLESPEYVDLSVLDMTPVIAEDLVADQDKSMPWRFATSSSVPGAVSGTI